MSLPPSLPPSLQPSILQELHRAVTSEALKSGKMKKKGHVVQNWKERVFILRETSLAYFDENGVQKVGYLILMACCHRCQHNYITSESITSTDRQVLVISYKTGRKWPYTHSYVLLFSAIRSQVSTIGA